MKNVQNKITKTRYKTMIFVKLQIIFYCYFNLILLSVRYHWRTYGGAVIS